MENYILSGAEISVTTGFIGMVTAIYFMIYANCGRTKVEEEADRVIDTVSSVVKGEVRSLKMVKDENPYDLFTRIYPTLKMMDNERLEEFLNLIKKYNHDWITEN